MEIIKVKDVLLIIALILVGTSCKEKPLTQDEIVKQNAEEYAKFQMNDPESYEFVKLELMDSILYSDNIEYRRKYFQEILQFDEYDLDRLENYKKEIPILYDKKKVTKAKEKLSEDEEILKKIDSLETILGDRKTEVASYTYNYIFRGKNSLGAKVINQYILQTNPKPNYKIINMTDDKNKVLINPNDFPGYREMITKYN